MMMKRIYLLGLFLVLTGSFVAQGQITNGTINYEMRIDQWYQNCDNDAFNNDDNEVRVGFSSDGNSGGSSTWTSGGNGATCGGALYVRRWQADAPSYTGGTDNTLMYYNVNRTNNANSFNVYHNSWEEDGSPDCDPSGDACQSSGTWGFTFKSAAKTPNRWWGYSGTADNSNWVTGQSGDFKAKTVWRYSNGTACNNALNFGTLSSGATYSHVNSNRGAPSGATSTMGYGNVSGNASGDVFYQFTLSTPSSVTISTDNSGTNYDSYIRLFNSTSCTSEIAADDDAGSVYLESASIINITLCPGTYVIQVEGFSSNSGDFNLSVYSATVASLNAGSFSNSTEYVCNGADPTTVIGASGNVGASGGVGPYTYSWDYQDNGGSWINFANNSTTYDPPAGIAAGTTRNYRRRVTDACGNQAVTTSIGTVISGYIPSNVTSFAGAAICGTGTVTITATAGANGDQVQWSVDGSSVAETDGSSGSFTTSSIPAGSSITVYARTRNSTTGCVGAWTSVTATANLIPSVVTSFANTAICGAGAVTVTANAGANGDQVQWSLNGSTVVETDGSTGSYTTTSLAAGTSITVWARTRNNTTGCFSAWTSVTAAANLVPSVVTSFANTAICGAGAVTITANAGANGDQVQWSLDGSTIAETDGSSGSYTTTSLTAGTTITIYARTRNSTTGCISGWSTATATANHVPGTATGLANQTRCGAGTVTFTAGAGTNGDQVQWSLDGSTVAETDGALGSFVSPTILAGTTTTVFSRTRNSTTGCFGAWTSATGTAYINPSNVTSFANTGICGTGGVTLTATAGVDGDQVQWSLDGSTVVETDGSSGSYTTPTVTAGSSILVYARTRNSSTGCFSGWVSVTATANVLPGNVTAFTNQGRCGTGSVTFSATAGTNGDQVQWSTDGSTVAETDVSPGSFNSTSITVGSSTTVYARTRNSTTGCFGAWTSATGSAYNAPVVTAPTVTQPLCDGNTGTIVVNGSGGFEYSINNGSTWQTSATFTGVAEGSSNNIVVRTNTSPACTTVYASNPVNINNPIAIVIAGVTPTNLSCNGSANGQIAVSASGGTGTLTYSSAGSGGPWGAQPFTGLTAGSYNIAVKDANNCIVSYVSNPVVLTQPTAVTMSATPYISCPGVDGNTTIRLSASGGTGTISYRRTTPTTSAWTTNPQFSMPNGSTTYSFEARDANLCTQNAPLTFSALTNPTVLAPSTISCTPCSTQNENRDLYLANGTDIVTVINDNGNNVGLVSGTVYVDGSSPLIDDGTGGNVATSPRHFKITFDSTNVANYVIIKFPIKTAELTTTENAAATSNSALDDLTSISTMGVTLWEGQFEDGTWGNGTKTYTQFIQQTANGTDVLGNKYIEIRTGRNSEFWPHSSGNNTPLPIELLDFKAICQNDQVTINWSTAVEVNNDYFTIQRSADLSNYQDIAVVAGAGNSNTPRSYNVKDEYPLGGQSYYRLMQTDFNSQFKVFNPVAVVCVTKDTDVISVFPNPAVDRLNVSLNLSNADRGRIAIYNQFGQMVASEFVEPAKGFSTYTFDTAKLPAGQYFINFMFEGKPLPTQKLIISR